MKKISLLFFCLVSGFSIAQETQVKITTEENPTIISKHIYGHFAEHLGRMIYDGLYVGEDSGIPNTDGVRNDLIEALKEIKIPNLRWPGGCFADTYHWKDGIGPKDERPTVVNTWWGGVTEDNSFGTHNFLNLCEELNAEPYLSANVGSGSVKELSDWLQYVNHDGTSPMADLRRENGRENPWGVKFWGVGNEMWGCGGNMTAEYYADVYKRYATFMSGWDNEEGLYRVASGASDSDYEWTEVLMREIPKELIDGVALHAYSVIDWEEKGSATDFSEDQYFQTMDRAWNMDEYVTKHIEVMEKYDPENEVDLVVDEWGGWYDVEEGTNPGFLYQQNTMRDAMIAGITLNIFNNNSHRVKMANLAQTVNVLQAVALTDGEKMILTPTYHIFKMYTVHHDATLLPVEFDSPEYTVGENSLPAISISASQNQKGKVNLSVVNIDAKKSNEITIDLDGLNAEDFSASILTSDNLQDHNTFDDPENIQIEDFKDFKIRRGKLKAELPPFSVIVFEEK